MSTSHCDHCNLLADMHAYAAIPAAAVDDLGRQFEQTVKYGHGWGE